VIVIARDSAGGLPARVFLHLRPAARLQGGRNPDPGAGHHWGHPEDLFARHGTSHVRAFGQPGVFAVYFFGVIPWRATKHFKQNSFLAHAAEFRNDETDCTFGPTSARRRSVGPSAQVEGEQAADPAVSDGRDVLPLSRRLFTAEEWEEFRRLAAKHLKKIR
jgi:hypothetical protein